jgi:hypothetical protein
MKILGTKNAWTPFLQRALTAFYYAGIAGIVGWSLGRGDAAGHPFESPVQPPRAATQRAERYDVTKHLPVDSSMQPQRAADTDGGDSAPARAPLNTRSRVNCDDCGVIESVRRIDRREEIIEGCTLVDIQAGRIAHGLLDGHDRNDMMPLSDAVADAISGERGAKKVRVSSRHQIVVRFRDGSRRVFNEETPRSLRVGDRIQVIAGAAQ